MYVLCSSLETETIIYFVHFTANSDQEDEGDVPISQRKRFTRVEMARVLMERNQVSFLLIGQMPIIQFSLQKRIISVQRTFHGTSRGSSMDRNDSGFKNGRHFAKIQRKHLAEVF